MSIEGGSLITEEKSVGGGLDFIYSAQNGLPSKKCWRINQRRSYVSVSKESPREERTYEVGQ